jgi:hypothetical protein
MLGEGLDASRVSLKLEYVSYVRRRYGSVGEDVVYFITFLATNCNVFKSILQSAEAHVKEMSFFWEVSGTSVQGNQSPRTARPTGLFPDLSGKTSTAQGTPGSIRNSQRWSNLIALNRSGGILPSNYH